MVTSHPFITSFSANTLAVYAFPQEKSITAMITQIFNIECVALAIVLQPPMNNTIEK